MEAGLTHPLFDPVRPWVERVFAASGDETLEVLNRLAEERGLRTESGRPVRFVPPAKSDPYYELQVYETGRVQTRAGSRHDLFNALAWLAFPATKARINARHAAEIPRERHERGGRRGRVRDMLTIFDEGGAIVVSGSPAVESLLREARWRELFVDHHAQFRIVVVGHAVMEQALAPYPGITCKVLFADPAGEADRQAAARLAALGSPRELPPLPVFGYPGWHPEGARAGFYGDARWFRPLSRPS